MSCDQAHILTLMHIDDLDVQHTKYSISSINEDMHSKCEYINEEFDFGAPR